MRSFTVKNYLAAALIAVSALAIQGCGEAKSESAHAGQTREIRLGVVGEHNVEWEGVISDLKKEHIKLTLVKFADYTIPNRALNDGDIDLNAFQHKAFLKADSESHGYSLSSIGDTIICPLGAYSNKIKKLEELKDGDIIAIPNDPTNGGRALKLLESAGLISLNPDKGYLPTVRDITSNEKHLKIYEVDAGNTPSLLPDVAVSIINSNYATDNHLNPLTDAIYLDATGHVDEHNPYVNIIAARSAEADDPDFKKVVKAYQSDRTARVILKEYHGVNLPVFDYRH